MGGAIITPEYCVLSISIQTRTTHHTNLSKQGWKKLYRIKHNETETIQLIVHNAIRLGCLWVRSINELYWAHKRWHWKSFTAELNNVKAVELNTVL